MKKVTLLAIALMFTAGSILAQSSIPYNVMDQFKQSHRTVDFVTWSNEGSDFRVHYYDEAKVEHVKVYDANVQMLRHEFVLAANEIPAEVSTQLSKTVKNSSEVKVWAVVDQNNKTTYFSENNGDRTAIELKSK